MFIILASYYWKFACVRLLVKPFPPGNIQSLVIGKWSIEYRYVKQTNNKIEIIPIDTPANHESEMELTEDRSAEEASAKWSLKSDRTNLILQIRSRVCPMLSLAFMAVEDKKFQDIFNSLRIRLAKQELTYRRHQHSVMHVGNKGWKISNRIFLCNAPLLSSYFDRKTQNSLEYIWVAFLQFKVYKKKRNVGR